MQHNDHSPNYAFTICHDFRLRQP